MYISRSVFVPCMYRTCSKMSLYIQASSFLEQFENSLYWVHTLFISTLDWKRPSSIFQINQSIHSNHHAFGFAPLPFAGGAAGCCRRIDRPRVLAGRAGRAGLRRSATAPAALASSAALDPAAKPKERRKDFPNSLDNPSCSAPTVLTIHRAAMDLSWSRMCCGDVDVATKIGDRRYYFSVVLCSNNQQLLQHNDMKLCGNVT
jgi:hypothetical protein